MERKQAWTWGSSGWTSISLWRKRLDNSELLKGIAAAFLFDVKEDEQSVELLAYVKENGIEKAVPHYTGIEAGSRMYDEIIKYYNELKGKYNR